MNQQERLDALKSMLMSRGWIDVVRPALLAAIAGAEEEWLSGTRGTGREKVTDDMLRGNIISLRWMLGWERTAAKLVDDLLKLEELRRQTEPAAEGGSPYA
jgi:hypothetical protein